MEKKILIGIININGIRGNNGLIYQVIDEEKLDFIGIAENKLVNEEPIGIRYVARKDNPPYFQNNNNSAKGMRGLLALREKSGLTGDWSTEPNTEKNILTLECKLLKISFIYCPPGELNEYIDLINKTPSLESSDRVPHILIGDFNCNKGDRETSSEPRDDVRFKRMEEQLNQFNFELIEIGDEERATYIHTCGTSSPDFVWGRGLTGNSLVSECETGNDHELIVVEVNIFPASSNVQQAQ